MKKNKTLTGTEVQKLLKGHGGKGPYKMPQIRILKELARAGRIDWER